MRQFAMMMAAVLVWGATASTMAAHHENKVTKYEMDSSGGTSTGHWISFVSFDEKSNMASGVAFASVGKGDTTETAFGITYTGRTGKTGSVSVEAALKAAKGNEKGKTTVGIVKITEEQYTAAKKVIATWKKKTEFGEDDTKASLSFSMEVMRATGLKFPFSGLATPPPLRYYGDISFINRKLGRPKKK